MAGVPGNENLFSAWQWAPLVRDRRVVWVVEKTVQTSDGRITAWRLEQEFDTKRAAMKMAGEMNNGLDWTDFPMRRVTDGASLPLHARRKSGSSGEAKSAALASHKPWPEQTAQPAERKAVPLTASRKPWPLKKAQPPERKEVEAAPSSPAPLTGEVTADDLRAALAARDGMWTFVGLWRGDQRVPARMQSTLSGPYWKLRASIEGRWNVPAGPTSRIQRELGLHEADELAPGVVKTRREKTRDGGVRVRAWVARAGCKWGTDASVCPIR
jgi:hypothetical protein